MNGHNEPRYGVVGAGTMGAGIAQKIALEGGAVTVVDLSREALDKGRARMDTVFEESVARRQLSADEVAAARARITFSHDLAALASADFVVEAVFEDLKVKDDLFARLEDVVRGDAVLATNTSSFRVAALQQKRIHPQRFVGLHFFYHPVKNRLLEIIPGPQTSEAALRAARGLCALMGKVELPCPDTPGFIVNRFFVPWLNEAVRLAAEGIPAADVEAAAVQAFGVGLGPFALMDATGVPIAFHAAAGLAQDLGPFYAPAPQLEAQAAKGPWGLATGGAFSQDAADRLLGVTWCVAGALVDEGADPADVDLGARVGLRWPKGPFQLFLDSDEAARVRALDAVRTAHPALPVPACLHRPEAIDLAPLRCEVTPVCSVVSLARPDQSNALDPTLFAALDHALKTAPGGRPLVLKGLGKNFAAGADIRFFLRHMEAGTVPEIVSFTAEAQRVLAALDDRHDHVVALVDGFALGGGAELMLCADSIAATPRARIGFPETGIGIYPGLLGTWRLTRRVGHGLARYLVGTGIPVSGTDAVAIGLADLCVPPADLDPSSLAWLPHAPRTALTGQWAATAAFMEQHTLEQLLEREFTEPWQQRIQKRLREKAPIALAKAFDLVDHAAARTRAEETAVELEGLATIFATPDALTGLRSIGGPRPVFTGQRPQMAGPKSRSHA